MINSNVKWSHDNNSWLGPERRMTNQQKADFSGKSITNLT